ncbi:TPA: hypothetical protein HA251_03335 [Candidatus Woesearchaeota archaeon]|nr:hypothetical protein [Candidatus Woesearchaeota archaeon]
MLERTDKTYAAAMEKLAYSTDHDAHDTSVVLNDAYRRYGLNGLYCRRALLGSLLGAYVVGVSLVSFRQPFIKYPVAFAGVAAVAINVAAAQGPRRRRKEARIEIESIAEELSRKAASAGNAPVVYDGNPAVAHTSNPAVTYTRNPEVKS